MPGSNSETQGRFCDGLGSNIMAQCSVGPIITLHDQTTAREYVEGLGEYHSVFWRIAAVLKAKGGPTPC
jgi:hypothetical protein